MKIDLREDYHSVHPTLTIEDSPDHPFDFFKDWYTQAEKRIPHLSNIMFLSTLHQKTFPTTRAVLLREYSLAGYIFYTHYNSAKGKDIAEHPFVGLTFYWYEEHRQLRITGKCEKTSASISDRYFKSRPLKSQVATVLSRQSQTLNDDTAFHNQINAMEEEFATKEKILDRPPHWGGICVQPHLYEFWQGRPSRIHERLLYKKDDTAQDKWHKSLLYP